MTESTSPIGQTTDGGSSDETSSGEAQSTSVQVAFDLEPIGEVTRVQHVLVSASYEGEKILLSAINSAIEQVMRDEKTEPVQITLYTTTVCVPVAGISLTDAWQSLGDEDRKLIHDRMPKLFTAIFLAIKGIYPAEKRCGEVSSKGSVCRIKGEHVLHVGEAGFDGQASSEVWTT